MELCIANPEYVYACIGPNVIKMSYREYSDSLASTVIPEAVDAGLSITSIIGDLKFWSSDVYRFK